VVVWTGTLTEQKGLEVLMDAWATVIRQTEAHLLLVGAGKLEEELREQARSLSIADSVTFAGYRPAAQVPAILDRCDVYVQPSFWEGLPNSVLEGMGAGLPLVGSDIAGHREIVGDSNTGILVPPGDSDALADALVEVLGDRDQREKMGKRAREHIATHFSIRHFTGRLEEIYLELAGRD
jgi:glycosyltransferase involved in cell wall biosynthesis